MTSYLLTFTVYTIAMVGFIFIALFAYKKFSVNSGRTSPSKFLEIEDCINLNMRKQLYVVKAGQERFLIASDAERTTFLAKLNDKTRGQNFERVLQEQEVRANTKTKTKQYDMDFDIANLYSDKEEHKDASTVLKNIVSMGAKR